MADFDFPGRVGRLEDLLRRRGLDAAVFSVGSDLPYFSGYEAMPSERLTMLVVRPGAAPVMFVPRLEVPRVEPGDFSIVAWDELDDPVALVASQLAGTGSVAIGDHTWSVFLVALTQALPGVAWSAASTVTSELRVFKDAAEIGFLRSAAQAVDRVLARVPDELHFSGRTEAEVAGILRTMTVEEGHQEATFSIVASGPNSASPHHEPGDRLIARGDLVVCDFGGRLGGYCSDVTRTFSVGGATALQTEIHAAVESANEAARRKVAPGVSCEEVDSAARAVIADAGFGEAFIHRTGHGIGLEVHEHPYIVEGNDRALAPGMTFSIEPGIYLGGRGGVRIEDIVACSDTGCEELNRAERGLLVVE